MGDLNPLLPNVSVILPVRNEAAFLERSLGAVLSQDYPLDRLEVIVADGMSTDGTREMLGMMQQRHANLRVIDNQGKIVATGLNAALARARGEIIVRVDGHTIIAPDYVRECVAALQRSDADNVGGRMDAVSEGWFGQVVARATSSPFGVGGARFHYSLREEWVDTVYLGAWRREVFDKLGGFDTELVRNQDDEFNYRLRSHGGRILLTPRIQSQYFNRSTVRSLWRQYFQYGYWKVRVLQKHPRQMRPRQFVPPLFVAAVLLSLLLLPFYSGAFWLLGMLGGLYVVANLAASLFSARKGSWRLLPGLPLAFTVLHFAYGSGFLLGLARFLGRWGESPSPDFGAAIVPAETGPHV